MAWNEKRLCFSSYFWMDERIILTNTLSLVFVSQRTSSCWIRSDSVPATLDIGHMMKWHPGSLKDLNWPKSSTMPTFCWRIHITQQQEVDMLILLLLNYQFRLLLFNLTNPFELILRQWINKEGDLSFGVTRAIQEESHWLILVYFFSNLLVFSLYREI